MSAEQHFDDPLLADFISELRSWGTEPAPEPTGTLASLLEGDVVTPVAAPAAPRSRRKRMLVPELLGGLAAKLAALGVAAKVGLGLGVATAAVTTAGVTGVLPDPAQNAVATVVEAVSPLQLSDPSGSTTTTTLPGGTTTGIGGDTSDDIDDDTDDDADADTNIGRTVNHGACVSAVAKDPTLQGREKGQAVSAVAKSDCGKESKTGSSNTSTTLGSTTTTSPSTTVAGTTSGQSNRGPGNGDSGNGNSGNRGNSGKSGNSGNSGNSRSGTSGSGNSGRG